MNPEKRRPLDCRDVIAVVGPAIEKGFSRANIISSWSEAGLCPFNEKAKYQPHIQATKGKSVKKNTLNYDALDHSKPMHPQLMEQIGKGNRLTTGKICGIPLTDKQNLLLFEALNREKAIVARGKAAQERKKTKKARLGDDELIQNWADYKRCYHTCRL
jgi:hypothetical protein